MRVSVFLPIYLSLMLGVSTTYAQTSLSVGDIAFTGYNADPTPDAFSFVLLKNIVSGTSISFTDKGWRGTAFDADGVFLPTPDETVVTWTCASDLPAGTEIKIAGTTATFSTTSTGNAGTVTGTALNLPTSGDQIFAFTGSVTASDILSKIITGIHMNADQTNTTAANWDGALAASVNSSQKPSTLTTGTSAVWIGTPGVLNSERDNGKFDITSGNLSTLISLKALIFDAANWISDDDNSTTALPTNGVYLGVSLPIELIDFKARSQDNIITLDWSTASELNNAYFNVERSADGKQFLPIAQIKGAGTTNSTQYYTYVDEKPLRTIQYYRLKQVDSDGTFSYSKTISMTIENGRKIIISSSNTEGVVSVQSLNNPIHNIDVHNIHGQLVLAQSANVVDVVYLNLGTLPAGLYVLSIKTDSGTTSEKIFKI